jgi:hypothetical protein
MILPEGYSDVPAGKIVAVVTHLEMTERPELPPDPPGAFRLRRAEAPDLSWYRDLYRRIGEEWLWTWRISMSDADLLAKIRSPLLEIHALVDADRDEGLLEVGFQSFRSVRDRIVWRDRKTDRNWRRPLADESRLAAGMVAADCAPLAA